MSISPSIEGSKIVTGYITIGNKRVLHSVVEYEHDGRDIILDWTRNLVITKKQYKELTKFVELSSFEGRKVIGDIGFIFRNLNIGSKPYVVFRDELIKDMQKNTHIFQPTEEESKKNGQDICDNSENKIGKSR